MVTKVYKVYADWCHAWVAVKRAELIDLGIADKISHYSYQRGSTVYLEEDGDLNLLIMTKRNRNQTISFIKGKFQNRSPIRSYDSYRNVA